MALAALVSEGIALGEDNENPRWNFLRTNLGLFPGTEKLFEPDVKLFWRLRADLKKIQAAEKLPESEHRFFVSTDADGRRLVPRVDRVRHTVLFLGDSCTFGIPVNDDETVPALVQKKLRRRRDGPVQCINAGVPGYSAFQGRIQLEQWNQGSPPDAVVITFWPNGRSTWDHLSDAEHEELLAAERSGEFSRHRLTRLLRRALPGTRPRLSEGEFAEQLRLMIRWCQDRGSVPILQVWPSRQQMNDSAEIDRQQVVRSVARQQGVPLVDLVPEFRKRGDSTLFVDSVHATTAGYALAADTLLPVLEEALGKKAHRR